MVFTQELFQRVQNGLRPVGHWKNTVAALGLESAAVSFKEIFRVCG